MGRPRLFDSDDAVANALDVFWERGYEATTPAALLEAIGVGKGSFYNAFGSKRALFERALRSYADDRVAGLSSWFADATTVGKRITGYFARLADPAYAATLRRGCFATNTAAELGRRDPAATKIVQRTFDRMESVFEAALREARESGGLDVDPEDIASLLLATLIGITVLARVDGSSGRTKRISRAIAALLETKQHSPRKRNR